MLSIMSVEESVIINQLKKCFPESKIELKDLVGDKNHYSLKIVDESFKGLSILAQHKKVKDALKDLLHKELHAITINTAYE
jgi:stress-induced morphogen